MSQARSCDLERRSHLGKSTLLDWIRELIGSVGHHLFFWSLPMSEDDYRREVYYELRKTLRDTPHPDNPRCFCPDCGADLGRFYSDRIRMSPGETGSHGDGSTQATERSTTRAGSPHDGVSK